MGLVRFTDNIQRHVACPSGSVKGRTVREILDAIFSENTRARGYVLNDQGGLRKHMIIFVDGRMIRDRDGLSDPVSENGTVDVMQALSGG